MADAPHRIDGIDRLREVVGTPNEGIELKVFDALVPEARDYLERSPFLVLSTADAAGNADASPKGDEPGFVVVEDDRTILIPDRLGNKLAYGLTNILENPRVGCLFVIPGTTETLRINGTAELTDDPALCERMAARGRPAVLIIRVTVEQCFFHCSKAFLRSKLWAPDTWPEKQSISFGRMIAARLGVPGDESLVKAVDDAVSDDARTNL